MMDMLSSLFKILAHFSAMANPAPDRCGSTRTTWPSPGLNDSAECHLLLLDYYQPIRLKQCAIQLAGYFLNRDLQRFRKLPCKIERQVCNLIVMLKVERVP